MRNTLQRDSSEVKIKEIADKVYEEYWSQGHLKLLSYHIYIPHNNAEKYFSDLIDKNFYGSVRDAVGRLIGDNIYCVCVFKFPSIYYRSHLCFSHKGRVDYSIYQYHYIKFRFSLCPIKIQQEIVEQGKEYCIKKIKEKYLKQSRRTFFFINAPSYIIMPLMGVRYVDDKEGFIFKCDKMTAIISLICTVLTVAAATKRYYDSERMIINILDIKLFKYTPTIVYRSKETIEKIAKKIVILYPPHMITAKDDFLNYLLCHFRIDTRRGNEAKKEIWRRKKAKYHHTIGAA